MRLPLMAAAVAATFLVLPAAAQETPEETYDEIKETFGLVPEFMRAYPKHGIRGAWIMTRDMEISDQTALPPKVKSLINVAVAAQIPCTFCVYADTQAALAAGATQEEIKEAVGQAALTRHWSTMIHGLQIDLEAFKEEMGGS